MDYTGELIINNDMDYTGELIVNNDTSVIGSGHKNKKYYKIQYVANGSNGKIAFFSFVNDPDQLYLIKVQGKGEYMIDYIEHEYFILNYLKSKNNNRNRNKHKSRPNPINVSFHSFKI